MHLFSTASYLCFIIVLKLVNGTVRYIDVSDAAFQERDESVNEYFDLIFANLRQLIIEKEVDHIHLPTDSDTFTATLFNSLLEGSIWVGDGEISGFSTIHRTGNMSGQVVSENKEMVVEGDVGLTNLKGQYNTKFNLGPFKSDFGVKFQISFVSLEIITDVFLFPTQIALQNCSIADLSTLQVHLNGVGILDTKLYNVLINTLTQVLEPVITNAISKVVCNLLEQAINGGYATESPPPMMK